MTNRQLAILTIVGGILAAVGSVLPWATVSSGFGSVSLMGTEADGKFSLIGGVIVAVLGFVRYGSSSRGLLLLTLLVAVAVTAIGAFDMFNLQTKLAEAGSSEFVRASVGVGLYVVIVGGVLAVFGSMKGKAEPAAAPPAPPTPSHPG